MRQKSTAITPKKPIKLKHKLALIFAPPLLVVFLRILHFLNRETVINENRLEILLEADEPLLVGVWHENAAMLITKFANDGIHVLASQSRDGELAVRLIKYFGVESVRGSSSRGGSQALVKLAEIAPGTKAVGFAMDGPRGPRRKSKAGIVVLAQRTGHSILPVAASATRSYRVKSWDRMCIPLPFGRYVYAIGDLIDPPTSDDKAVIKAKILEVETALNQLQKSLESQFGIDPLLDPDTRDT